MRLIAAAIACISFLAAPAALADCAGVDILDRMAVEDAAAHAAIMQRAEEQPNPEGRFWRIEREGVPPSHLFGTFHTNEAVATVPEDVWQTLDEARIAVFELSREQQEAMEARMANDPTFAFNPDGMPLSQRLRPDQLSVLGEALETRGVPLDAAELMRPWLLFTLLAFPACHLETMAEGDRPLDDVMTTRAIEGGVPHVGLEDYESALAVFGRIEPERFLQMMVDAAAMRHLEEDVFRTQFELYAEGQLAAIDSFGQWVASQPPAGPRGEELYRAMLDELVDARNLDWLPALEDELEEGGAFVAVGGLHLPGEEGLIELLRERGWTVTRVD